MMNFEFQDLTEQLQKQGMHRVHYKNETMNINLVVQMTHIDLKDKLKDDPSWKKLENLVSNYKFQILLLILRKCFNSN